MNSPTGHRWQRSVRLDEAFREQLEALFFFNPRQSRMLPWIEKAIERFGIPKLETDDRRQLRFTLDDAPVDALYLLDREQLEADLPKVAALALHRRVEPDRLAVVHLALDPDVPGATDGALMDALLLELRALARQADSVRQLWLLYGPGEGRFLRVR